LELKVLLDPLQIQVLQVLLDLLEEPDLKVHRVYLELLDLQVLLDLLDLEGLLEELEFKGLLEEQDLLAEQVLLVILDFNPQGLVDLVDYRVPMEQLEGQLV
jgi:hypothetical protein